MRTSSPVRRLRFVRDFTSRLRGNARCRCTPRPPSPPPSPERRTCWSPSPAATSRRSTPSSPPRSARYQPSGRSRPFPSCTGSSRREPASATGACPPPDATMRQGRRHIPARHGHETGMDRQSENLQEPQSEPLIAGLAPPDELETDEVPDSLVSEFSSLTTPYCWVITEDAVAGYDGAEPTAVGKSGPDQAVAGDVAEALTAGRFFRLVDGQGRELAVGRLYDPS